MSRSRKKNVMASHGKYSYMNKNVPKGNLDGPKE